MWQQMEVNNNHVGFEPFFADSYEYFEYLFHPYEE